MTAQYREEPCRSALNRVARMPFAWSLNPYMGCVHRCTFCYVRGFERRADRPADERYGASIRVKINLVEVLRRELARASWKRELVAIGRTPILMIVGDRDNRTGKPACEDLASYLRAAGANVTVNTYQNARHGFDDPAGPLRADPQGENITRCIWQQGSDGLWRERASGISGISLFRVGANDQTIAAYNRSRAACRTLGTETQGDAALRGRAVGEVTGFMKTHVIDVRVR